MPTENIQEFRSVSAWNVSFVHSLHASFQSAQVAEPINHWLDQGPSNRNGLYLQCRIFGKAQKLLCCHNLVKCYGNLQDKFQFTTLLQREAILVLICLFHLDQGPHTVQ